MGKKEKIQLFQDSMQYKTLGSFAIKQREIALNAHNGLLRNRLHDFKQKPLD